MAVAVSLISYGKLCDDVLYLEQQTRIYGFQMGDRNASFR